MLFTLRHARKIRWFVNAACHNFATPAFESGVTASNVECSTSAIFWFFLCDGIGNQPAATMCCRSVAR